LPGCGEKKGGGGTVPPSIEERERERKEKRSCRRKKKGRKENKKKEGSTLRLDRVKMPPNPVTFQREGGERGGLEIGNSRKKRGKEGRDPVGGEKNAV